MAKGHLFLVYYSCVKLNFCNFQNFLTKLRFYWLEIIFLLEQFRFTAPFLFFLKILFLQYWKFSWIYHPTWDLFLRFDFILLKLWFYCLFSYSWLIFMKVTISFLPFLMNPWIFHLNCSLYYLKCYTFIKFPFLALQHNILSCC